jgi:hypothetical protein
LASLTAENTGNQKWKIHIDTKACRRITLSSQCIKDHSRRNPKTYLYRQVNPAAFQFRNMLSGHGQQNHQKNLKQRQHQYKQQAKVSSPFNAAIMDKHPHTRFNEVIALGKCLSTMFTVKFGGYMVL